MTLGAGWFAGVLLVALCMTGAGTRGVPFGMLAIGTPLVVVPLRCLRSARAREQPALRDALAASLAAARRRPLRDGNVSRGSRFSPARAACAPPPLGSDAASALSWKLDHLGDEGARLLRDAHAGAVRPADAWAAASAVRCVRRGRPARPRRCRSCRLDVNGARTLRRRAENVPWWVAGVALALAIFGALRHAA